MLLLAVGLMELAELERFGVLLELDRDVLVLLAVISVVWAELFNLRLCGSIPLGILECT